MHAVVGLGNPGPQYENTRHNAGFMVLDKLAKRRKPEEIQNTEIYKILRYNKFRKSILLIKPKTYMNMSGVAVKSLLNTFKIKIPTQLLVVCDDLDLPFGTVRLRPGGSDAGQKGLRSIINTLNTTEVPRLRIGIGRAPADPVDHVLSTFTMEEEKELPKILEWAADSVEYFVRYGVERTMNWYNRNILQK